VREKRGGSRRRTGYNEVRWGYVKQRRDEEVERWEGGGGVGGKGREEEEEGGSQR